MEWVSPPMTLENNVWVGEMYEGQDILYQVNCSGDSIAPATDDPRGGNRLFRIIGHQQENLNHPDGYDRDFHVRHPCSNEPAPGLTHPFAHRDLRLTAKRNGEIRIDLFPQALEAYDLDSNSHCYTDSASGTPEAERFCPKYTIGAVNAARIKILNRNPTITVEAIGDEVVEGEPAVFKVRRLWVEDHNVEFASPTMFRLKVESTGGYYFPPV